jgi:hypothetical protein
MSWTAATPERRGEGITCCVCGRRAPQDPLLVWSVGWQVRNDYPIRYRCPRCRRRQEPEGGQAPVGGTERSTAKPGREPLVLSHDAIGVDDERVASAVGQDVIASRGRVRTDHALDRAAIVASSQHPDIGGSGRPHEGLSWRVPTRRPSVTAQSCALISASTRKESK